MSTASRTVYLAHDCPRLPVAVAGIRLPPVLTYFCGATGSCQGSETTDWQAPASRTTCQTPAWRRLHAQAQNEATGDWLTTGKP
eukprot:scaffold2492_cov50-Cyclotella_meneghiniana.AAC.4